MRKSKDITKYSLEWQVVRVECKAFDTWQEKVEHARAYLDAKSNKHALERVANWMQGLARGYRGKDDYAAMMVEGMADELLDNRDQYDAEEDTDSLDVGGVATVTLRALYKDLIKRQGGWMKGGYVHREQAAFEDMLAKELEVRGVDVNHQLQLDKRAQTLASGTVTHKFFF